MMKAWMWGLGLALLAATPAMAFDSASQDIVDRMKPGKLLAISDVGALMLGAERWCYNQRDEECGWSDIYLSVDTEGARYELSNAWDENVDISFVSHGLFRDDRYICESGEDWLASVRAYGRDDGYAIEGRDLEQLKQDIAAIVDFTRDTDCFDYLYQSSDADALTITLLQRQYIDGATDKANDATVTLHYDKADAENLGWYW